MKRLILVTGVALASLTLPALAQSYDPQYGTGNTMQPLASDTGSVDALAYAPARAKSQRIDAGDVFGQYTDPDPNIRFQLKRDWPGRD